MTNKGHTVHANRGDGQTLCGVTPRRTPWSRGIHSDIRYVTCPKCERALLALRKTKEQAVEAR